MSRRRRQPAARHGRTAALALIAEDHADLRYLFSTYLAAAGFQVETAGDGEAAFRLTVELRPDVVIMNLGLPRLDGWEVMRRLKIDYRTAHIPIVACSGYAFGSSVERALDAGCDGYVVKPCSSEELTGEVRRVMARSATRRRA
jgi:CheY-like chemotaxis protein